jgi:transcriptional regulator with XRE-family HTH domain
MHVLTEKLKGFSQTQIASLLNMEQSTYSKIELGKSNLRFDVAFKIASIIEKDISEFSNYTNQRNLYENKPEGVLLPTTLFNHFRKESLEKIIPLLEEILIELKQNIK